MEVPDTMNEMFDNNACDMKNTYSKIDSGIEQYIDWVNWIS